MGAWPVGQASPGTCGDDCVESYRYFDGLAREYFSAAESEKTGSDRFFRNRKEWGPRGELVCEWCPGTRSVPH
jgi:hypothetical protein